MLADLHAVDGEPDLCEIVRRIRGRAHVVTKPFKPAELLQTVNETMQGVTRSGQPGIGGVEPPTTR